MKIMNLDNVMLFLKLFDEVNLGNTWVMPSYEYQFTQAAFLPTALKGMGPALTLTLPLLHKTMQ